MTDIINLTDYTTDVKHLEKLNYEVMTRERLMRYLLKTNQELFNQKYDFYLNEYLDKVAEFNTFQSKIFPILVKNYSKKDLIVSWSIDYDEVEMHVTLKEN